MAVWSGVNVAGVRFLETKDSAQNDLEKWLTVHKEVINRLDMNIRMVSLTYLSMFVLFI